MNKEKFMLAFRYNNYLYKQFNSFEEARKAAEKIYAASEVLCDIWQVEIKNNQIENSYLVAKWNERKLIILDNKKQNQIGE